MKQDQSLYKSTPEPESQNASGKTLKNTIHRPRNRSLLNSSKKTLKDERMKRPRTRTKNLKITDVIPVLNNAIYNYFQKGIVRDLKEKRDSTNSNSLKNLHKIFDSQKSLKKAFSSNLKVSVKIPKPISIASKKPVLVLDLDETLIHSTVNNTDKGELMSYYNEDKKLVKFRVIKRPYVDEFLKELKKYYTLILFTASERLYADTCLTLIDPENKIFSHRLYKDSCMVINKQLGIKDLRMFKKLDRDNVFIVDNNPTCYMFQFSNAIPIRSFYGSSSDVELLKLTKILYLFSKLKNKHSYIANQFFKPQISMNQSFASLCHWISDFFCVSNHA